MKQIVFVIIAFIACLPQNLRASDFEGGLRDMWAYDVIVTDSLYLDYKQNNIRFLMTLPEGEMADSVEYRHMIRGYKDQWSTKMDGPWAYYINLPPGDYTFTAQARVKGGNWGPSIEHRFVITNPWWRRWPALLAYVIVSISLIVYITYLIRERIRISNQMKIERINQQFRNELVLQATRKFRTPLVVIRSIIENINPEGAELSRVEVRQLRNSSRELMQMVEELTNFGHDSEQDVQDLDAANTTLTSHSDIDVLAGKPDNDNNQGKLNNDSQKGIDADDDISSMEPVNDNITVVLSTPFSELSNSMSRQMQTFFNVILVESEKLFDYAKEYHPDAIVLDTDVKDFNAYEILRKLKTYPGTSNIPVVLISSFDSKRSLLKAIHSQADDYLKKPFNCDVLAAILIKKIKASIMRSTQMRYVAETASGSTSNANVESNLLQNPDVSNYEPSNSESQDSSITNSNTNLSNNPQNQRGQNSVEHNQRTQSSSGSQSQKLQPIVFKNAADKEFKERLDALIEQNLSSNTFDVGAIASGMAVNRMSLCNKVKELTGLTPVEYLRRARLNRAAQLLTTTTKPVFEICELIGMIDATYFHRRFKEMYGLSPNKYRYNSLPEDMRQDLEDDNDE